jgi:hypothetical protein
MYMKKAIITCGRFSFDAEFLDTKTTQMMFREMPFTGSVNFWGDEIYFPLSFTAELEENAKEEVEVGTLAYWPPSKAFCIFFGPTPVSTSSLPKGYSAVNICGKIHGNLDDLRKLSPGEKIKVELMPTT